MFRMQANNQGLEINGLRTWTLATDAIGAEELTIEAKVDNQQVIEHSDAF
jgi:hypothetical protein